MGIHDIDLISPMWHLWVPHVVLATTDLFPKAPVHRLAARKISFIGKHTRPPRIWCATRNFFCVLGHRCLRKRERTRAPRASGQSFLFVRPRLPTMLLMSFPNQYVRCVVGLLCNRPGKSFRLRLGAFCLCGCFGVLGESSQESLQRTTVVKVRLKSKESELSYHRFSS